MKKRYILIAIVLFIGLTIKVNAEVGDLIYEITKLNISDTENGVKITFEGWAFIHLTNNFRGDFRAGKSKYQGGPTYEGGQEVMIVAEDQNGNKTYLKNILYDGYNGENAEKLKKYRHGLLLLYFPFYLAAFAYLEKKVPDKAHIINCAIDLYIPFVEVFIIPYLLWFAYVAVAGIYFFFKEKESFCKWMYFGMIGMTIFIIVSYLYPNGLELRPETFTRDNIFVQLTKMIYSMDTPTNVLPSIHVFNSMAVYFAVKNSPKLKNNKAARTGAFVMTSLIILSTMFLKQHSVVDVLTALILSCLSYDFIYNERTEKIRDGLEELKFRRKRKEFSKY